MLAGFTDDDRARRRWLDADGPRIFKKVERGLQPGFAGAPDVRNSIALDYGFACDSADDCAHQTCIMPGDDGNITNDVFGFCSRGCDCDDAEVAKLPSDGPVHNCVYPGGCFVGQSQGAWRHAVLKCSTLEDCTAVDARYTDCSTTSSMTVVDDTCGNLKKVCQAHAN